MRAYLQQKISILHVAYLGEIIIKEKEKNKFRKLQNEVMEKIYKRKKIISFIYGCKAV